MMKKNATYSRTTKPNRAYNGLRVEFNAELLKNGRCRVCCRFLDANGVASTCGCDFQFFVELILAALDVNSTFAASKAAINAVADLIDALPSEQSRRVGAAILSRRCIDRARQYCLRAAPEITRCNGT